MSSRPRAGAGSSDATTVSRRLPHEAALARDGCALGSTDPDCAADRRARASSRGRRTTCLCWSRASSSLGRSRATAPLCGAPRSRATPRRRRPGAPTSARRPRTTSIPPAPARSARSSTPRLSGARDGGPAGGRCLGHADDPAREHESHDGGHRGADRDDLRELRSSDAEGALPDRLGRGQRAPGARPAGTADRVRAGPAGHRADRLRRAAEAAGADRQRSTQA